MATNRRPPRNARFIISRKYGNFCMCWDSTAEYIREALRELTAGRSAFLTNIALTEKAIKNAGFGSLVTVAKG